MFRRLSIGAAVAGVLIACSLAVAGDSIQGSNPRAEPIKQALAALVKGIESGDFEKAKAVYAGDKADLDLLKVYVDGVAAAKDMRAAIRSKFGDHPGERVAGFDEAVARMAVKDFNTVLFLDDPDRAASSADSPLGVGFEFKRVNGKWEVLSLASRPNTPQQHIARVQKYIGAVKTITDKVNSGAYHDFRDAAKAASEAGDLLWPIEHAEPAPVPATGTKR